MNIAQHYGCNNCTRHGGVCRGENRNCQLKICMAEHIAESGKIEKFVRVLGYLHMTVLAGPKGFQIVNM